MSELTQFFYTAHGPSNGDSGAALATEFVRVVSGLPDVHSICDLGCGNGYLCSVLEGAGVQITGVDASETGIELAKAALGDRGTFLCAPIDENLPARLGGTRFDAVVSSDVIEHMYHPRDLLNCAGQLLNPGGWLVLGTPYHGYLKNLALSVLDRWDAHHTVGWDGGHIKFFSVTTLSSMVTEAGFSVQHFNYIGRAPWLWKNMICVARKGS